MTTESYIPIEIPAESPPADWQDVREEMMVCERPRNRATDHGVAALSDAELLALVLQGAGAAHAESLRQARKLLAQGESLRVVARDDLTRFVGAERAIQLGAVAEIARRLSADAIGAEPLLDRPEKIVAFMAPIVRDLTVEKFFILCLDRRGRLKKRVELTSGTANATLAHPREVWRVACLEQASAIICVHNHPSGDPTPSAPDLNVTRMIRESARVIDITLIDHIVIGRPACDPTGKGYYSFREAGII
jgi:DNA repair protein RadC